MSENSDDTDAQNESADSSGTDLARETGEAEQGNGRRPKRVFLPGERARLKKQALALLKGSDKVKPMSGAAVAKKLKVDRRTVYAFAREEGLGMQPNTPNGPKGVYKDPKGPRKTNGTDRLVPPPGAKKPPKDPKAKPKRLRGPDPLDPDVMVAAEVEAQRLAERRKKQREDKRRARGSTATDDDPRERRPDDTSAFDPEDKTRDQVGLVVVPEGYDATQRLAQFSRAWWLPEQYQLSALKTLAQIQSAASQGRGKIDWDGVTVAAIPEDHRHRLAGALLAWVDYAELPEAVRMAPKDARKVYRMTGLLPESPAATEAILRRWKEMRLELREMVGGAMVAAAEVREPVQPALAAETRYQPPRWGAMAGPISTPDDDGLS